MMIAGAPALSAFRIAKLLSRLQAIEPTVAALETRFVHFVDLKRALTAAEREVLERLLTYGPRLRIGGRRVRRRSRTSHYGSGLGLATGQQNGQIGFRARRPVGPMACNLDRSLAIRKADDEPERQQSSSLRVRPHFLSDGGALYMGRGDLAKTGVPPSKR